MWVIDASIAVKWFFTDEPNREIALRVLQRLGEAPERFFVPDLFFLEVTAVLLRKSNRRAEFVAAAHQRLTRLGLRTFPTAGALHQSAIDLAVKYEISLYDAIYLALAVDLKCKWLTTDRKALRLVPTHMAIDLSNDMNAADL